MITAPLLTVGVQVDLPESNADSIQTNDEPLEITISKDGEIFIQETQIETSGYMLTRKTNKLNINHGQNNMVMGRSQFKKVTSTPPMKKYKVYSKGAEVKKKKNYKKKK